MALFGAIVAIGLGPALWLGAQFAQAAQFPVAPPPVTVQSTDRNDPLSGLVQPENPGTEPVKPRIVPAGPPARGHGGAADPLVPSPSPSRSSEPTPSAPPSQSPSPAASSSSPSTPASSTPVQPEATEVPPAIDNAPVPTEPFGSDPAPFEPSDTTEVLARG